MNRRDVVWAIAVALLTGALYLATLRPDVGGTEDSPKFQFLGQVLGTAHTPGYPFYTIATYVFTRVPFGTLAYRVNLFSAICGVFSCVMIFLIARRMSVSRSLAAVAALAAATGFPVWSNAITAEVYTLAALMSAWTIYLLIAWIQIRNEPVSPERPSGRGGGRLYAACIVFAAGLGNHLTIVGLLPAALIYGIARDRSVLRPRVLATAAVIGAIGVAQYGFIALRTIQGAPYLEARATTIRGVYDVIIARDVSWARFYQAADKVVGIEVPMLLEGLRVHMGTVTVILVVIGIAIAAWRRNWDALLVAGGAAGTLAMIANLWGDVVGFITPVVVLLWTLAAYGLETIVRAIRPGDRAVNLVAATALLLPLWNLFAIYPKLAQVLNPGDSPAMRMMYSRLPDNSAVVAHNYFVARILNYLHYSNEYDPDPSPRLLDNDAEQVRAAAAEGRPAFALEGAIPWLTAQGLRFEPTGLSWRPFERWMADQPAGTTVLMASAGRLLPFDWLPTPVRHQRGRPANFGAVSWTTPQPDLEIQQDDSTASITRELGGRPLAVFANDEGPQVKWGDDVLAAIDRGLLVVVINPSGRVIGRWQFRPDEDPGAQIPPATFVFRGEVPCETLRTTQRVDVSKILADGSWYATVDGRGIAEVTLTGAAPPGEWRHRLTNGRGEASVDVGTSRLILTAVPGTRSVFRLSVKIPHAAVTATLESSDHAVRVCHAPITQLPSTGALDVGPDHDERFGSGWHMAEHAGTQQFRWSTKTSSTLWRMEQPADVRLLLRLRAAHPNGAAIRASLNGVELPSCALPAGVWIDCRLEAPASATRAGVNDLQLSSDTLAPDRPGDPRELAFAMQHGRVRVGK